MNGTHSVLARAALAASLGLAAGAAQAVPIVFEFAGTVGETRIHDAVGNLLALDYSLSGQTVTGRIVVETDGLAVRTYTNQFGSSQSLLDYLFDPPEQITSELFIGGVMYDVGAYSGDTGHLWGIDSSGVPGAGPDLFDVSDVSMEYWYNEALGGPRPAPGEYQYRQFGLQWTDPANPLDLVDLSNGLQPLDVLPLLTGLLPRAYYTQERMYCDDTGCSTLTISDTDFSINSLTVSTANVPEPGTLALFGIGLLGSGLVRRRKAS
ncbi:PEP-CTERM sorting domain-containing protein [Steroidobacter agaridevorans]|nr:PEP-CTERM sorting domain-containing protein [Steroidobacter agaridevorans]